MALINKPQDLQIPISNSHLIINLDANRCKTLNDFIVEISKILQFPEYYGHNLDALEECLYDLSWINFDLITLLIYHSEELLSTEKPIIKDALIDILSECTEDINRVNQDIEFKKINIILL